MSGVTVGFGPILGALWREGDQRGGSETGGREDSARNLLVLGRRPHGRSWEDPLDPAFNHYLFLPSNGGCDLC